MNSAVIHLLFLCLCSVTLSLSAVLRAHECVNSNNCLAHDFQVSGPASSRDPVTLSFAVKLRNMDKIYQILEEVSNPKSSEFGKHLTLEEVQQIISDPQAQSSIIDHLLTFVNQSQVSTSGTGGYVRVKTDIKTAEKILKTKYHKFKSTNSGRVVNRALEYEIPVELSKWIDYVHPTVQFPSTKDAPTFVSSRELSTRGFDNANSMNPGVLNTHYNISSNEVQNPRATQSIFSAYFQSFSPTDLKTFQKYFRLPKHPLKNVVGTNMPKNCKLSPTLCFEGSLDVQYLTSMANAHTTFWVSEDTSFFSWIEEVSSAVDPPLVHSISYSTYEETSSESEMQRFAQEAAILGTRGVTIVVSSGNDGVANYKAGTNSANCGFHPSFPASVPYVVSVGATTGPEFGTPEVSCQSDKGSEVTSGGGFSTVFPQPAYQTSHVEAYLSNLSLNTTLPPLSAFRSQGRAYPDVAMAGHNYQIRVGGKDFLVSGTSAATPVFAGILTLANNARLNIGKSSLGFINPTLYSLYKSDPSIFNDITVGNNRCTSAGKSGDAVCCPMGFTASKGWDPVSGLGSVNAGRLIEALTNL